MGRFTHSLGTPLNEGGQGALRKREGGALWFNCTGAGMQIITKAQGTVAVGLLQSLRARGSNPPRPAFSLGLDFGGAPEWAFCPKIPWDSHSFQCFSLLGSVKGKGNAFENYRFVPEKLPRVGAKPRALGQEVFVYSRTTKDRRFKGCAKKKNAVRTKAAGKRFSCGSSKNRGPNDFVWQGTNEQNGPTASGRCVFRAPGVKA